MSNVRRNYNVRKKILIFEGKKKTKPSMRKNKEKRVKK